MLELRAVSRWVVGVVLSMGLVLAPSAFAARPIDGDAGGKPEKAEKKGKGGGKEGAAKDEKEEPKEPAFDKLVKGAREVKGLFTVYVKEDEGKYFLELSPDQLGVTYLLNPTVASGVGEGFLYPADVWQEYPVRFVRSGKTIRLIHINANFRASEASSMARAAAVAAPDAIVSQTKIESQPHPDRKSVLVDMSGLFLGDLEGMSLALKAVMDQPYGFDKDGSSMERVQGFPENLDFETQLHFRAGDVKNRVTYAADTRSLLIRFRYSLSRLPGEGFRPRLADDRVGHFVTVIDDYSDDTTESPAVRYVTRWRLEKQDPHAAISEPKRPIVYYLENSIPPEYRDAVRKGIEGWNAAFEAAGFRNAIVAKDQPADPEWDAADVRYATIRWIVAPGAGFAQGPSRINPYTGEIFDADIRFSADMIRYFHREHEYVAAPAARAAVPGPATLPRRLAASLSGWTDLLGPFSLETLAAAADPDPGLADGLGASAAYRAIRSRGGLMACDYAGGFMEQAAFGLSLLQARGKLTPEAEKDFVNQAITSITLHEVGHTLGLRHNFKASGMLAPDRLQDSAMTAREGLTGSVMDYIPVNLAPEGKPQGQFYQTEVGPYDKWAIEYSYKTMDADSPEAERPELSRIASRCADPRLAYGTDEDAFTGSPRGMDPVTNMWDLGNDPFAYYKQNAGLSRELIGKIEKEFAEPGTRYQRLRSVFGMAIGQSTSGALNAPKYIGGIRHNRDHIGDPGGRLPYEPVPAAEQRQALAFLTRDVFGPDAFKVPPSLLNKLAMERLPDIEGTIWQASRNDYPIHDLVLFLQSIPMSRLYSPLALARLNDLQAHYGPKEEPFTMAEMFGGVRKAVWSELAGRTSVNSFRRNLQRMHLQTLIGLVVDLDRRAPEDARSLARADLVEIRRGIDATLAGGRTDVATRAHLDESRARINEALSATVVRKLPG